MKTNKKTGRKGQMTKELVKTIEIMKSEGMGLRDIFFRLKEQKRIASKTLAGFLFSYHTCGKEVLAKSEQTETQILGNCWHYFKTRIEKYWKKFKVEAMLDTRSDNFIESVVENIANSMTGELTFANWKKAVDEAYPV